MAVLTTAQEGARGSDPQGTLPANLDVNLAFRPVVERMWRSSLTFRRQCRRLAAEPLLRVRVLVEEQQRRPNSYEARTVLTSTNGVLSDVVVFLRPSWQAPALIAHEFEHVLEQLDGVDFQAHAGTGAVRKNGPAAFETRRAIEAGARVSRELAAADGEHGTSGPVVGVTNPGPMVVPQQLTDATPFDARTARVSAGGRHVVFVSSSRLAPEDTNDLPDVYVLDLATGRKTLESIGLGRLPADLESRSPDISADGRYVVFESRAGNLVESTSTSGVLHVFLRDRERATTRLISASASGRPAGGRSWNPVISADGGTVAFESTAADLAPGGEAATAFPGVFLFRLVSGERMRVDVTPSGAAAGPSMSPAISADGRFVAFASKGDPACGHLASCEGGLDRNGVADIYLSDTWSGRVKRISRSHQGGDANGPSYDPAISGDGRVVAFVARASNLTAAADARHAQIHVHDLASGSTELATRTPRGRGGNGSSLRPSLSHDGSRLAFQSVAGDLLCAGRCEGETPDINLVWDVFVYDRTTRRTIRASLDVHGEWMAASRAPSLDARGRVLAFASRHPMNDEDEGHEEDLFVRVLDSGTSDR